MRIKTVKDLVFHFPFRYEDFRETYKISDLEPGQQATVQAAIQEIEARRSWRRRMVIVEALVGDDTGSIRAIWFNQPFIRNILKPGRLVNLSGKVSLSENELYLSSPTYELVGKKETAHTGRLVPIYPETKGLTSKGLRFLIQPILKSLERLTEWIPESIRKEEELPELNESVFNMHFPQELSDAVAAKKRFAFEDLFLLQLLNIEQKLKLAQERAPEISIDIEALKSFLTILPFELTLSQKKSLWEILQDMQSKKPMNRLLQGDVGSGKTVVAFLAAIAATRSSYQSAFMAPTEVLARQHYETIKNLLGRADETHGRMPSVGMLTSSHAKLFLGDGLESEIKKPILIEKIKKGEVEIVVGTHALIQKSVSFKNLGLVVIDEQHRFGVEQRATLASHAEKISVVPHFLSMSATPIPRTLMLTIFGDLDISTIDELPKGRKQIITKIVEPANRAKAYGFIRNEVRAGRQAFVICPRIEKDEDVGTSPDQMRTWELKSVKEEHEKLTKHIFPDLKIAMLHGQMKPKEKEKVMSAFRNNEHDVLVATSVIEVGVDVPNATVMMIEGSDRFGLAQLYQFRGRVGRGAYQSYCLLFTDSPSKSTHDRLSAILDAKNGFELAEKDLAIRGPGQFLGTEQTGLPDLAMRGLQDITLIKASRAAALRITQKDPRLERSPTLKEKIREFRKKIHQE